ncbi:MAG: CBS domain-containing protein [Nitrososphaeraceae archaeon]|nr:CBS domain-containing protein [Nitrososphaeraceae archaeon]
MKIYDVMSVDIICAKKDATIIEVATRIVLGGINGVPIINDDGVPIGIITTIDILRAIKDGKDLNNTTIGDIMKNNPLVTKQNDGIEETIDIMDKNGISMIPVVEDDGRIIGICSRSDILKEILNERFVMIGRKKTTTTTLGVG